MHDSPMEETVAARGDLTDPAPVPEADQAYAMAVCALPRVGPVRAGRLRSGFGSFQSAWRAGLADFAAVARLAPGEADQVGRARAAIVPEALPKKLKGLRIRPLFRGEPSYPALLAAIHDAPAVVYSRGEIAPDDQLAVAVVGTRRASAYGTWMASRLAGELAGLGYTIVSGLARGIDGSAHRAALRCGGRTVAVLAGGLDVIYPPEHADLALELEASGFVLSEHLPGVPTLSGSFPARNRLISGLAVATIVVEAGLKSGAMITARFAVEQGREVLAVPGRVGDPGSQGPSALIKEGAGLVETAADVIGALPDWAREVTARRGPAVGPAGAGAVAVSGAARSLEAAILGLLAQGPQSEQQLIEATAADAGSARAALVMLEMRGSVTRLPGAIYAGRPDQGAAGPAGV